MPHLAKKTLSQFIRTGCKRQLRLNRTRYEGLCGRTICDTNAPKLPPPGLEQFAQAGEVASQKMHDLVETFGRPV